ncbi:oligopeptide transport system ATP-binding protein [Faunimonas pinastri]|uniref:Oligopeptide transport system ATP-binding protein n=1 Tax=Faunimonas pinastri TaxID=1855383 RepID=A0A1H9DY35_9HYPH|nr:ABC transporter ATP-binding protein [Faunimonas pinastri]SEQ18227.1 oligopeptide transport system ATP-binding protein [Faunimonas pinastri]
MSADTAPILEVRDLRVAFDAPEGLVSPVDRVSFSLQAGKTIGLVGESGCGKSMTALAIMGLLPRPSGRVAGGEILFRGQDLCRRSDREMQKIRGNRIAMVFQEPMTSLNPVLSVGEQIAEAVRVHQRVGKRDAINQAVDLMALVGIPAPRDRARDYPHQFSGGMRQRVMIAIALACRPDILIADEPTTALDVTIQAQIMDLLMRLREERQMAMILITHDLGVLAEAVEHVCVMYAGRIVESAPVDKLLNDPRHPYTQRLLAAIPRGRRSGRASRLQEIPGSIPPLWDLPGGCRFCPRLEGRRDLCRAEQPPRREVGPGHFVACWAACSDALALAGTAS